MILDSDDMMFTVHSIFRNRRTGQKMVPHGLEWDMGGDSLMAYVPIPHHGNKENSSSGDNNDGNSTVGSTIAAPASVWKNQPTPEDTPAVRRAIVEAHNRWCFAKDLPYRRVDDIDDLRLARPDDDVHYYVKWRDDGGSAEVHESRLQDVRDVIKSDPSATGEKPPSEVWINGVFVGMLRPETLSHVLDEVADTPSVRLSVKRTGVAAVADDEGVGGGTAHDILRVERRFRGMIRGQEVFEHVWDNLLALEDAEILDGRTVIGTATVPDWIMGGDLTSRLWVQETSGGNILFLRPLYNDDVKTADRRYELQRGRDDAKIRMVKSELERIRYLAGLPAPYPDLPTLGTEEERAVTPRERQHQRNGRKFLGL